MRNFVIRMVVNAAALSAAAYVVAGIHLTGGVADVLIVAFVFGIVNALLKPLVMLFSIPFLILTLGLFTFVVNAAMLMVTAGLTDALTVDGIGPALVGSLVVSIVSTILGGMLKDEKDKEKDR